MTPAGNEPATFRFVAQQLKHCATAVPTRLIMHMSITGTIYGFHFLKNIRGILWNPKIIEPKTGRFP